MVGDRTPDWNAALTASCSSKSCWRARMYSTAERRVSTLLIFLFAAPLGTCSRRVAKPLFTSFTRLRSLSFRLATACGCCGGKLYPKPAKLSLLLHRSSSGEDERCLFACFDADLLLHWLSVGLSWMLWDAKKQAGGMNCWWFTLISILAVKSISRREKKVSLGCQVAVRLARGVHVWLQWARVHRTLDLLWVVRWKQRGLFNTPAARRAFLLTTPPRCTCVAYAGRVPLLPLSKQLLVKND